MNKKFMIEEISEAVKLVKTTNAQVLMNCMQSMEVVYTEIIEILNEAAKTVKHPFEIKIEILTALQEILHRSSNTTNIRYLAGSRKYNCCSVR